MKCPAISFDGSRCGFISPMCIPVASLEQRMPPIEPQQPVNGVRIIRNTVNVTSMSRSSA